MRGISVTEE